MGKHLGTSPKKGWYIATGVVLAITAALAIVWSYQFIANHPDVWGDKSPSLHEGVAMIVVILAPLAALAYFVEVVFRPKTKRRTVVVNRHDGQTAHADLVSR